MYHQTHDEPVAWFGYQSGFEDRYVLGEMMGSGTFGKVYKGVEIGTGKEYAVKRMGKRFGVGGVLDKYYVRRIRNEVDIGNHLGRSLNIAYVYEVYEDEKQVDIVMELCTGGTLWDAIVQGERYTGQDLCRIVRDILRVVALCHSQGVLIRDIKPDNFLFANMNHASAPLKAIDFGVSVFCEEGERVDMRAGTPMYISPEVLKCDYGHESDVWSAGIVAYMVLTGKLPWTGDEGEEVARDFMNGVACANKDIFRAILYAELDFSEETWDGLPDSAKDLVQRMLDRDRKRRPTAAECLQHEWMFSLGGPGEGMENSLENTVVQRLQRFGTYGLLKQQALRKMAHVAAHLNGVSEALADGMTSLGIATLSDGRITKADLRDILVGGNFDLSPEEAEQLMLQMIFDADDAINPDDWCAAMTEWKAVRDTGEWEQMLAEVFEAADIDQDDALGAEDVERLLCGEDGCDVSDMVGAAIREADSDGDGALSFGDFRSFLTSHESELEWFDDRKDRSAGSDES